MEDLDQRGDGGGSGKKWSDSEYIWKVNSAGFASRLYKQNERMRGFKDDPKIFCFVVFSVIFMDNWKDGVASVRYRRQWERNIWVFRGWKLKIRSSVWVLLISRWLLDF